MLNNVRQFRTHKCAARSCDKQISLNLLFCGRHWMMIPRRIRERIWIEYHTGIKKDTHPTPEYESLVDDAVRAVDGKVLARQ